jgi:hypothetical protein
VRCRVVRLWPVRRFGNSTCSLTTTTGCLLNRRGFVRKFVAYHPLCLRSVSKFLRWGAARQHLIRSRNSKPSESLGSKFEMPQRKAFPPSHSP